MGFVRYLFSNFQFLEIKSDFVLFNSQVTVKILSKYNAITLKEDV